MNDRTKIQVDLVKLTGGGRLLRLGYSPLKMTLEKKIDPKKSLVSQKKHLFQAFEAALAKARPTPA